MKVEFLYPELTNLLGENGSLNFFTEIFGEDNVVRTSYPDRPRFLSEEIALVFMGAMTEKTQRLILDILLPLREEIQAKIADGQHILFTGNSIDLLGEEIVYENIGTIPALNLYSFKTYTNRYDRCNDLVYGLFDKVEIIGFISQFTRYEGETPKFIHSIQGNQGLHDKNLYAASLLGPLVITSPQFSKYLLASLGFDVELPHEQALLDAFAARKQQIKEQAPTLLDL
ncbi:MAG TPA: hypothetical protein VFF56_05830 [Bacillota bacterium]|nr:hypothetical protein [Bacillota bacterium]